MHKTTIQRDCRRFALGAAAWCVGAVFAATAVTATAQDDAQARYEREVQACRTGQTGQATESCLKEARNAHAARKEGQLATDNSHLQRNRLQRCDAFEGEAKAACIARMSGHGQASGSVAGGGILRSAETVVVKPDAGPVRIEPKTDDPVILVPRQP